MRLEECRMVRLQVPPLFFFRNMLKLCVFSAKNWRYTGGVVSWLLRKPKVDGGLPWIQF